MGCPLQRAHRPAAVPLFDLKFLNELATGVVGTSNRRHYALADALDWPILLSLPCTSRTMFWRCMTKISAVSIKNTCASWKSLLSHRISGVSALATRAASEE